MRRNSKCLRTTDGGKTWEVFKRKPRPKKTHEVTRDSAGKLVVVRLVK